MNPIANYAFWHCKNFSLLEASQLHLKKKKGKNLKAKISGTVEIKGALEIHFSEWIGNQPHPSVDHL